MMISTILLIANILALIVNGAGFMSFWWNVLAYVIETALYVVIYIIFAIIVTLINK